ncbi:MAG: carbon monoxide dehydrogenase subunit G [Bacteroidota bacterium]
MHLEGTHTLKASAKDIWAMLMDHQTLAKVTPGIKTLEPAGDGKFKAVSDVKLGPVSGSFKGTMEVVDPNPPQSFTLKIKQNSKIGNVAAEGSIALNPTGSRETEVVFSGDAKLSGTLARTGQRVLSGVARTLTNEFFQALEDEIALMEGQEVKKENFFQKIWKLIRNIFSAT